MTRASEQAYFTWHARELVTGTGALVDLGSWLGSTTAALAIGLRANRSHAAARTRIHAYDRFVWEPWMDAYAALLSTGAPEPGGSFVAEFEATIAPWRNLIEVHAGDLVDESWDDSPIELLLIDAMKSWELAQSLTDTFLSSVPSRYGFVIHQDFANCYTPWIHILTYRLREALVPVTDVVRSETVVFRVAQPLDLTSTQDLALADAREAHAAFTHSLRITRSEKHSGIHAASVMFDIYRRDIERARARLVELHAAGHINAFHTRVLNDEVERAVAEHREVSTVEVPE